MRILDNARLIFKAAAPIILAISVSIGLIFYAYTTISGLSVQTKQIVDVQVKRLEGILSLRVYANEASIVIRNIILETRQAEMDGYKKRYDAAVEAQSKIVDHLLALSDSPERRRANEELRRISETLRSANDRVINSVSRTRTKRQRRSCSPMHRWPVPRCATPSHRGSIC